MGETFEITATETFEAWLDGLRDREAQKRISVRIKRFKIGHFGDVKPVGGDIYEARIHCGPGYRLYYMRMAHVIIVMLCGGDKNSQARDIAKAKEIRKEMFNDGSSERI